MSTVVFSDDFRSVCWCGEHFSFTTNQAAIVAILWEHHQRNTPEVGGGLLLERAGVSTTTTISQVFRQHPAWQRFIVHGQTRGSYRLVVTSTTPAAETHG